MLNISESCQGYCSSISAFEIICATHCTEVDAKKTDDKIVNAPQSDDHQPHVRDPSVHQLDSAETTAIPIALDNYAGAESAEC